MKDVFNTMINNEQLIQYNVDGIEHGTTQFDTLVLIVLLDSSISLFLSNSLINGGFGSELDAIKWTSSSTNPLTIHIAVKIFCFKLALFLLKTKYLYR